MVTTISAAAWVEDIEAWGPVGSHRLVTTEALGSSRILSTAGSWPSLRRMANVCLEMHRHFIQFHDNFIEFHSISIGFSWFFPSFSMDFQWISGRIPIRLSFLCASKGRKTRPTPLKSGLVDNLE